MDNTYADTILYGGEIIPMDEKTTQDGKVEAIAIADGLIKEVGSTERVFSHKGPNTEVIFLNQQTLMPGFIEPHQHAIMASKFRSLWKLVDISGAKYRCYADIREVMLQAIESLSSSPEGHWAVFVGWDPELVPDLPTLSAKFLDENLSSDVPIGVIGQSLHVKWVTSLALSKAGITDTTPDPVGGAFVKDESGHLMGQLFEGPAIHAVFAHAPRPPATQIVSGVMEQWRICASAGFTTITELAYRPSKNFDTILQALAGRKDCPIRLGIYRLREASEYSSTDSMAAMLLLWDKCFYVFPNEQSKYVHTITQAKDKTQREPKPVEEAKGTNKSHPTINYYEKLWEAGVKFVADGSPHCGTAAIREQYLNTPLTETLGFPPAPCYGKLNFEAEEFVNAVRQLTDEGKQMAVHCHGETACEVLLKAYEEVLAASDPTNRCRHRMEHIGLMTTDQIARTGKLNIALSFFVDHLRFYGNVYKTGIFGEERVNRWTPLSEATENGVIWTIHQDHPAFPDGINPFGNMKTTITRTCRDDPDHPYGPECRVSVHEALKAYTINAAWQLHMEDQVGSITVGKKADLVVLSDNPYHKDPFKLEEIRVVETFVGGHRNELADVKLLSPGINVLHQDIRREALK